MRTKKRHKTLILVLLVVFFGFLFSLGFEIRSAWG